MSTFATFGYLLRDAGSVIIADPKIASGGVTALTFGVGDRRQGLLIDDPVADFEIGQAADLFGVRSLGSSTLSRRVKAVDFGVLQNPRPSICGDTHCELLFGNTGSDPQVRRIFLGKKPAV